MNVRGTADMRAVKKLIEELKTFGLSNPDIVGAIGLMDRNSIRIWQQGLHPTTIQNQNSLELVLEISRSISSVIAEDCRKEYLQTFFSQAHKQLGNMTPGQYLIRNGSAAREDLILLAKHYAGELATGRKTTGSSAASDYALMHVQLDVQILHRYHLDDHEIAEIISKDQRRVKELIAGSRRASPLTRLEAHQIRQAASAAVKLGQYHHWAAVRGLMTASSQLYEDKWKTKVGVTESIVEIIGSQIENDPASFERADFLLGHILSKLTASQ